MPKDPGYPGAGSHIKWRFQLVGKTKQIQSFSDLVADFGLLTLIAAFAVTGIYGPGIVLFAVMILLAIMRSGGAKQRYQIIFEKLKYPYWTIDSSRMGRQWFQFQGLSKMQKAQPQTNRFGKVSKIGAVYDRYLYNMSYWAMPFILAFGPAYLKGAYTLCMILYVVHYVDVFARYTQISAWARRHKINYSAVAASNDN